VQGLCQQRVGSGKQPILRPWEKRFWCYNAEHEENPHHRRDGIYRKSPYPAPLGNGVPGPGADPSFPKIPGFAKRDPGRSGSIRVKRSTRPAGRHG